MTGWEEQQAVQLLQHRSGALPSTIALLLFCAGGLKAAPFSRDTQAHIPVSLYQAERARHEEHASEKIFTVWERDSTEGKHLRWHCHLTLFSSEKAKFSCYDNAVTKGQHRTTFILWTMKNSLSQ